MSSGSDQINSIIEHAISIADSKQADAGLYANDAFHATDTVHVDEGVGQWNFVPSSILPALPVAPAVSVTNPIGVYSAVAGDITVELQAAYEQFFLQYFPNDIEAHDNAVLQLTVLANQGIIAAQQLAARLDAGNDGLQYLKTKLASTNIDDAKTYVGERYDVARQGASFLQSKFADGGSAATYLLNRFNAGDAATVALINMITSGGTGLPAPLEDAVWQRDRARIVVEAARADAQTVDGFAARGFPLPTGAAAMLLEMTQSDAQNKISQASRDVAVKQIDTFVENVRTAAAQAAQTALEAGRTVLTDSSTGATVMIEDAMAAAKLTFDDVQFTVKTLIDDSITAVRVRIEAAQGAASQIAALRTQALQATAEYVRMLAIGPQVGSQVASAIGAASAAAAEAITRLYGANVQAFSAYASASTALDGLKLEAARGNADNAVRLHTAYNQALIGVANAKANSALGAAQAAGYQGAAALSTLNAIASLTSSD